MDRLSIPYNFSKYFPEIMQPQLITMCLEKLLNKYDTILKINEADIRTSSFYSQLNNESTNIIFCYDPKSQHRDFILTHPDFIEQKTISAFLKNNINHKIRVYTKNINISENITIPKIIIFANRLTIKETYFKFLGCVPILYNLTDKEDFKNVFISLSKEQDEEIYKFLKENITLTTFDEKVLTNQLQFIVKKELDAKIRQKQSTVENYNCIVEEKINTLRTASQNLKQAQEELTVLLYHKETPTEIPKNLINICTNEDIQNIKINEQTNTIHFHIYQPIRFFDESVAERLILNSSETKAKFLRKCFIEQTHQIYWATFVTFDLTRNTVMASSRQHIDTTWSQFQLTQNILYPSSLQNVHIMNYNCWGMNQGLIDRALINNDLEAAILQTLTATASINLADGTVLNRTIELLKDAKAIKTPEGTFITYNELQNE